jgi:integral membrane protein (TIGR00529 family)
MSYDLFSLSPPLEGEAFSCKYINHVLVFIQLPVHVEVFCMDSLQAFVIALAVIVAGVFLELPQYVTMLLSLTLLSILVFGSSFPSIWLGAFNESMLTVITSLVFAMYLAELFKGCKASEDAVNALEALSPRLASMAIPALVGLLPMPGGAYVSATLVNSIYSRGGLRSEEKTFINFWFRHIWIAVWPLYQGVLIASYTLGLGVDRIISDNWPILLASIITGVIMSWRALSRYVESSARGKVSNIVHIWPFASIAFFNLCLKLDVALSTLITIALFTAIYRPGLAEHLRALKHSLNPSILILIVSSLIYSYTLSQSGVAGRIASILNPPELVCYLIPAIIVFATGFEFTFSAIALPVLKNLINSYTLFLLFLGGFVGSILSPVHVCLVLSAQYFKADLRKVYRYTVPSTLLTTVLSLAIAYPIYVHS